MSLRRSWTVRPSSSAGAQSKASWSFHSGTPAGGRSSKRRVEMVMSAICSLKSSQMVPWRTTSMSGWRLRNAAMHPASQFSARLIGQEMTTVLLRAEATIASVAWSIWSSAWRSVGRNASPISVSLRLRG